VPFPHSAHLTPDAQKYFFKLPILLIIFAFKYRIITKSKIDGRGKERKMAHVYGDHYSIDCSSCNIIDF
jgi:hypothetical protein